MARSVVDEPSETVISRPGEANSDAGPEARTAPEHAAVPYSRTVEPASAVPLTRGELTVDGEAGSVCDSFGGAGAIESATYVMELAEQAEVLPAASVAVARSVVAVLAATVTGRPGDANSAAVPVAAAVPVHVAVAYSRTVEPGCAVPVTFGVAALAGDPGSVPVIVARPGAVESSV